jgi:DNA-binding FrmR family transcriptional regulator
MAEVIVVKKKLHPRKPIAHQIHGEKSKKSVLDRLSRSLGHLESVRKMVVLGADATEILIQLAAVRSEINSLSKIILENHCRHCLAQVVEKKDAESIDALDEAIAQLLK